MASSPSPDEPVLERERHIRYWLRHFKTLLPTAYTSFDSNRMFLAFMTVTALDILGVLHASPATDSVSASSSPSPITSTERAAAVDWIYRCQHPDGGFRGFPGTDFGHYDERHAGNRCWDVANAAGTFFALGALVSLRDDLARVDRAACLRWLRSLQTETGSFAEMLGPDGKPYGSRDVRQGYLAIATRYILEAAEGSEKEDIDRDAVKKFIYATQTFDGGTGGNPGEEAHGGYAYCVAVALKLLGELDETGPKTPAAAKFIERHHRWLVAQQVHYEDEDFDDDENSDDDDATSADNQQEGEAQASPEAPEEVDVERWVGFHGRCNKPADTCYSFWVGGSIMIHGLDETIDKAKHRKFLLERTEHRFGGFGKVPGDLPDIMHSFLGLAALALFGQKELAPTDATFCMTQEARRHLENLRREQLTRSTP